jgi:CHAT domain-containing protein/Tfp pilus assembly protein PilF
MSLSLSPTPSRARGVFTGFWRFLALLALGACATVPPSQPATGWSSKPVERSIQPGGTHSHPVSLEAGQFLRAFVEQDGADVEVRLLDPHGEKIAFVDGPHGPHGEEELAAIAKRSGLHQIEVHLGEESATGKYRLRIESPRLAEELDRWRVEALRLTQEAVNAIASGDSLHRQVELRLQALHRWQRLGDRKWLAETLHQLGVARLELGQYAQAAEALHRSAELWRAVGDPRRLGDVLNQAGRTDRKLDTAEEAKAHYEEALVLSRRVGDRELEGKLLNNLGSLLTGQGEARSAIIYLEEALRLAKEWKDPETETSALINLGSAHEDLGEREQALDYYKQAFTLAQTLGDKNLQAAVLNNLGNTFQSLGAWEEAIQRFEQALALNRELGDGLNEAKTLNNLGVAREKLGQIAEAYHRAEAALAKARESGNQDLQATILTNLAYISLTENRPAEALEFCEQALPLAQFSKEQQAATLSALGSARRRLGDRAGAREALHQALILSQERQDPNREAGITLELARLRRDEGDLRGAADLAARAIELIESIRGRVVDEDLRALFLASKQSYYGFYIDILMELHRLDAQAGFAARAFEQSERARARGFLDSLAEAMADAELLERERRLRGEINALDRHRQDLLRDRASSAKMAEAARRLEEAVERYKKIESDLTRREPLSLEQLQKEVVGDALLLEYTLGDERSYLWAVTADSLTAFVLPPRSEIEAAAQLFYERLTARNSVLEGELPVQRGLRIAQADEEAVQAAAELSRIILLPVEPLLGSRPLLVVSDGALQRVPFSALPFPSSCVRGRAPVPLIQRHGVVSLPSASVLKVLRDDVPTPTAQKTLAVLANPVFKFRGPKPPPSRVISEDRMPDLSRLRTLPFSKIEADAIASLLSADQVLKALGHDASVALATGGELARYRFVHFATHGIVNSQQPELSGLVLSRFDERGEEVDGFLSLPEVYNLRLNADLVVLSACGTALGKEIRGEGLIGLTRGFMYAGTSRVLASLWSIDDQSTAKLMESFYRGLLVEKRSAPEALRHAQLEIARQKRWKSPYFWAGFSLQGELR